MSKQVDEIVRVYELLEKANTEIGHVWKLPTAEDNLYFVLTECAEVIDAVMRSKPEYFRNNSKEINLYEEACDTVMMLMKYLMATHVGADVLRHECNYSEQLKGEENYDIDLLPAVLQTMQYVSMSLHNYLQGGKDLDLYFEREDAVDCIVDIVYALQDGMLEAHIGAKVKKYYTKIQNA